MGLLFESFRRVASSVPRSRFVRTPQQTMTYGEAWDRIARTTPLLHDLARRPVGVRGTSVDSLLLLAALDGIGAGIWILPKGHRIAGKRLAAILDRCPDAPVTAAADGGAEDEVVLFTAGTTGTPKAVAHTWDTLSSRVVRSEELRDARWLFPYQIASFAGLQVVLHAVCNGACLSLTPLPETNFNDVVKVAVRDRVTHMSGTPTFFRFLLASAIPEELSAIPARQLTLGGEVVDQVILDSLRRQFPLAAITHIYASSETGVCFSVHDGREGFPADYVGRDDLPARLQVLDGQLYVSSPHGLKRYPNAPEQSIARDSFVPTGDLVERRGDRYHFLGRRENTVNVGGRKVAAAEVEAVMLRVAGVVLVEVFPLKSSLAGQIVQASVVVKPGCDREVVRRALIDECTAHLDPHKRPRVIHFMNALELSGAGKIQRAHA